MAERTEVVFVDGVRTPFGRAGEKGMYWNTRADDLVVKAMIGLLERNPALPHERIDDVAIAATTQQGDQGLTLGRTAAHPRRPAEVRPRLRDRPHVRRRDDLGHDAGRRASPSVPTTSPSPAASSTWAATRWASDVDPNPRFVAEKLVERGRPQHGQHGREDPRPVPAAHQGARRPLRACAASRRSAAAYDAGKIQPDLVPVAIRSEADGDSPPATRRRAPRRRWRAWPG